MPKVMPLSRYYKTYCSPHLSTIDSSGGLGCWLRQCTVLMPTMAVLGIPTARVESSGLTM
jgi:hypothetical protein